MTNIIPYWYIAVKIAGKKATKDKKAVKARSLSLCEFKAQFPDTAVTHTCSFPIVKDAERTLVRLKQEGFTATILAGPCSEDKRSLFPETDDPEHAV